MKVRIFSLLLILSVSCSAPPVKEEVKPPAQDANLTKLEKFFVRSESDSIRAGQVIEKHNIIQQLTHLRFMDKGGKKYYLLERENITEMINAVTEGIYLDYVLINKHGDIIYTKNNNTLFGTNINEGYEDTPLKKCFSNKMVTHFEDVALLTPDSKIYSLYVSSPVYKENNFHGILVLQIDISKINEILESDTAVINKEGVIKVASDLTRINSQIPDYGSMNINGAIQNGPVTGNSGEDMDLQKFNFRSISWILVKKKA